MLMTETAVLSLKQHLDYNPHRDVVYGIKADKPMNQVLVFVIRGIATKWKQPIAYFFANSCVPSKDVATMLQEALVKIKSTGLNVRAVVCDQGPTNISALKLLGFSRDKPYTPYIQHPSHEKKIHVIFDPPHLVENVRNNLIRHNIIIGKNI